MPGHYGDMKPAKGAKAKPQNPVTTKKGVKAKPQKPGATKKGTKKK